MRVEIGEVEGARGEDGRIYVVYLPSPKNKTKPTNEGSEVLVTVVGKERDEEAAERAEIWGGGKGDEIRK